MAKQLPKTLMLPDPEGIRSLDDARRVIRQLEDEIQTLVETLYGVLADHESRLTAGGL